MATARQRRANRRNAQRSTGPKSAQGKARASMNALRHGLRAEIPVLPGEDADELQRLRLETLEKLDPDGALETALAERAAMLTWRLARTRRLEHAVHERLIHGVDGSGECDAGLGDAFVLDAAGQRALSLLNRYEAGLQRMLRQTLDEVGRLRRERRAAEEEETRPAAPKATPEAEREAGPERPPEQEEPPAPRFRPDPGPGTPEHREELKRWMLEHRPAHLKHKPFFVDEAGNPLAEDDPRLHQKGPPPAP